MATNTRVTTGSTVTSLAGTGGTTGLAGAAASAQARRPVRAGEVWRFARHLVEMVLAMLVGMAALGLMLAVLGEPPGYDNSFVKYAVMSAFMAAPMVAWMRHRGHPWLDGLEMAAAMTLPTFAVVLVAELGAGMSDGSLMMWAHVAMYGGMVALMLYRWDRYARHHHAHGA